MKTVDNGPHGNQCSNTECTYAKIFHDEYSMDCEPLQPIWSLVKKGTLCAYPSFKGDRYEDSPARLMVVGRAMNGWGTEYPDVNSGEDLAHLVLQQTFDFRDVVNEDGNEDKNDPERKKYFYSRSRFWKLIKRILEEYGESDEGDWYHDSQEWHKRIVWSNLYKIAPKYTGNPDWALIKLNMSAHVEIMRQEILSYHPNRILFVTDMNYFYPWKREPSFAETFCTTETDEYTYVVATGQYNGAKIVVCRRPDAWGTSDETIHAMAQEIKQAFDS